MLRLKFETKERYKEILKMLEARNEKKQANEDRENNNIPEGGDIEWI